MRRGSASIFGPRRATSGPVKLIGGDPERERPDPTALSNRALAMEGGYDYQALPGTGHLLQLEAPVACAEAAQEFLAGIGFK
jgi:pimeloyl-ACP methyl ester carboxylesterase